MDDHSPRHFVLLAEDDADLGETVELCLSDLGYNVVRATCGVEAASLFLSDPRITVVFSDIQMGGGAKDGHIFHRTIAPELLVRNTHFVAASGDPWRTPGAVEYFRRVGVSILQKPFRFSKLIEQLGLPN